MISNEHNTFSRFLILSVLTFVLAACGSGGGNSGVVDNTAPAASILFPPAVSATEGNSIIVRGTTTDTRKSVV